MSLLMQTATADRRGRVSQCHGGRAFLTEQRERVYDGVCSGFSALSAFGGASVLRVSGFGSSR